MFGISIAELTIFPIKKFPLISIMGHSNKIGLECSEMGAVCPWSWLPQRPPEDWAFLGMQQLPWICSRSGIYILFVLGPHMVVLAGLEK